MQQALVLPKKTKINSTKTTTSGVGVESCEGGIGNAYQNKNNIKRL